MITQKRKREELQLLSQEALDAYMNRPAFRYDADGDALYRHYKDQYTQLGKTAMQDTMGQAAALTGGYGSSYAQNVGQQAYQSYLSRVDDVIPELYQLAYQKYQDEENRLYKTYQRWAQLEQQSADREQWGREYEQAVRKQQDDYTRFRKEQERRFTPTQTATYQPDYWASLATYRKLGQNNSTAAVDTTAAEPEYDNGKVSEGNVKTMQRVLGLEETGKWTEQDRIDSGNRSADKAWEAYQKGQLQNYKSVGLGDQGLANGNVRAMERMLGLREDGYWSKEDSDAVGGLSEANAWKAYQSGLLRKLNRKVQNKVPNEGDIKSMERVLGLEEDGIWSESDKAAADGFSADTAWEAYKSGALQRWKSKGLFEHGTSNNSTEPPKSSNNTLPQIDPVKPESNYNDYLTAQKQIQTYIEKLNREIYLMENDYAIYEDLTTREIGKAEEPKLAQFRQKYPSLYDMQDAIEEMKEQTKQLHALAEWAGQEAEYLKNYSDKTYNELQTVLESLEEGTERNWVANYALSKMTQRDYTIAVQTTKGKIGFAMALQDEDQKLKKRLRILEPGSEEAKEIIARRAEIYSQYGDLGDYIKKLNKDLWWLERAEKYKFLNQNQDFAELSQVQDNGSWLYKMVNDPSTAGIFDVAASVGKYVGPMVGTASLAYDAFNFDNLQYMNDDERTIFNYIYAKEGEDAAKEYLDYLQYELNRRSAEFWKDAATDFTQRNAFTYAVGSSLRTAIALTGGKGLLDATWQNVRNAVTGEYKPVDYNRDAMLAAQLTSAIQDAVAQDIEDAVAASNVEEETFFTQNSEFLPALYRLAMDVQDSVAVKGLSKIHPAVGVVASSVMSDTAGTQIMLEAQKRGTTDEEALKEGVISVFYDALLEESKLGTMFKLGGNFMKNMMD